MKRVWALILTLLLCAGMAQAEGWKDGKNPGQPYGGVPEVNLDEEFGYMMFYPTESMTAKNGCAKLLLYVPREDVQVGKGTFYVYTMEDGEIVSFQVEDEGATRPRAIETRELDAMLWGGGTCFEFVLPRSLEMGKTYFVNMTRGCLITEGGVDSPELGGSDAWRFAVEGDFGVNAMAYRRAKEGAKGEEDVCDPKAGDTIRFDLVLGGDAVKAVLYGYDDSVLFEETELEAEGEITGTVMADNPKWGVMFLDDQNNAVGQFEF